MNKKRNVLISIIVMILFCCIVFCSCSQSSGEKMKGKMIGFSQYNTRNSFYNIIQSEMQKKCDEYGIHLIVKDSDTSVARQISDVTDFVEMKVDAIIINPVDRTSLRNVIEDAKKQGIPVVAVDNILESDIPVDVSIMADNYGVGKLAGEWLSGNMGEQKVKALYLSGVEETIVSENRRGGLIYGVVEGYLDQKENADFEIVARKKSDWTATGTYRVVSGIDENLNYNCIMSEAQSVALTTYQILKDEDKADNVQYIACATTDTLSAEAIKLIMNGTMASGYQNPYMFGNDAVDVVISLWNNEPVEAVKMQPTILITKDNFYDYFDIQGNHKEF